MIAYAFLLANDFLRFFTEDRRRGWEETATSWLISAVVISVICAGLMLLYKFLQRRSAGNIREQAWSRGETVLLMLLGLIPVFIFVAVVWYSSANYYNVMRVPGLFKGVAFSWLLYLLLMVVGHLAGPWRRDLV